MFQTDITIGIHELSTSEERVVAAVNLAYNEYISFLVGIMDDLRLGEINKAESENVEHKGTLLSIKFEIEYIPAGDTMECNTVVLENFAEALEVKNVTCDCCKEEDSEMKNVIT